MHSRHSGEHGVGGACMAMICSVAVFPLSLQCIQNMVSVTYYSLCTVSGVWWLDLYSMCSFSNKV